MDRIGQLWRAGRDRFAAAGIDTAALDARLLLRYVLGLNETGLIMAEAEAVDAVARQRFEALAARRLSGEPVARILGYQEFYGLAFALNEATLIPRPETEMLVDFGRESLSGGSGARILDLGTGSGCIALALLAHLPHARAVGTDIARRAVVQARANAQALGLANRFEAREGGWYDPVRGEGKFDLIVSNPPYIAPEAIEALDPGVRDFDPRAALDGGAGGLDAYRAIVAGAGDFLAPGGALAVEIGFDQSDMVSSLFSGNGFEAVAVKRDLAGHDRVVHGLCGPR